ncbi:MAG: hypothetical protein KIT39_11700 [Nitrospirales bacterium]|nr:hypothetical protein [Nitrospirales bacterium]
MAFAPPKPVGHLPGTGIVVQNGECNPILDQAGTWIEQKPGDRIPTKEENGRSGLRNKFPSDKEHEPFRS